LQFVTRFTRGKTASLGKIVQFAKGEQKAVRSSTISSTQTRQTSMLSRNRNLPERAQSL
jgi:hypothetical protein